MKTFIGSAALCVALSFATPSNSAELPLPKDGWVSWEVPAVENSPAWCCWSSWDKGKQLVNAATCDLDAKSQGYGTRDKLKTDAVRVYARLAGGKVERVRGLAASCPVETRTPIQKLDNIATDESARWLLGLAKDGNKEYDEASLSALAMHRGNFTFDALSTMARSDPQEEARKHAIFWLALLRGMPGADLTANFMFNDPSAEVRQHAAFALAQSESPRKAADLIKLGQTDKDDKVRGQAWFWLAHTGDAKAEAMIVAAAKQDPDKNVREQAIFALSQLPDERATPALIRAVEDRSISRDQRERAMFWLAQSDSPGAQTYLDKVLTESIKK
jgi:HEAT repeat protein